MGKEQHYGELNFSKARLSFFKHFPSLTLTLYDITLKGSAPFQQDILVAGDEVALGVNLSSVFFKTIYIDKIILSNGYVNIQVDSSGNANYNVYKSSTDTTSKTSTADISSASLKLDKIVIEKSRLIYNDRSIPMIISAKGFNYTGKGDLDKAVFDLYSTVSIDSLDFNYSKQDYVQAKKIQADLITKINTQSLALVFEKNNLKINRLPIAFNGKLEFLPNGYNIGR
jgi:AsmA protein